MAIKESELLINEDGSLYHINLLPSDIANTIILVGDQDRVKLVASYFDGIELQKNNREFYTCTGRLNGERLTVISTGIGTDNIDIVINELDALVNIDLKTRQIKAEKIQLNFIRIGTSGGLQAEYTPGSYLVSDASIGFDGMLNYYDDVLKYTDLEFEKAFKLHTDWNPRLAAPYIIQASKSLNQLFVGEKYKNGITISANGFYGPQGRELRLKTQDAQLNDKIHTFEYQNRNIANYEMESSALLGLSKMLGHKAATVCLIIANRITKDSITDYHPQMKALILDLLTKITEPKI